MNTLHEPVLVNEILEGLNIQTDGIYIDATFGRGGHSLAILKRLGPTGRLMVMDKDPAAIEAAKQGPFRDARLSAVQGSFAELLQIVQSRGWHGKINGVLMDLGVSSPQLDDASRGFSFIHDGPLDMRMNPQQGLSAADWINQATENDICHVLRCYGEERFARRIANAIVVARNIEPIVRTRQLSAIISAAIPVPEKNKHPATRSFQAIRIFINNELTDIETGVAQAFEVMACHGRLCVISFHSLEDRIVKRFIQNQIQDRNLPREIPLLATAMRPHLKKINGLIRPQESEVKINPRARSARLRIAEKLS